MRAIVLALLFAGPALARDPLTGIEDDQDLMIARQAAMAGKRCKIPHGPDGRQIRNRNEVRKFRVHFACPSTGKHTGPCPGWVVDHVKALHRCGPDKSWNMAWQTVEDAKEKDRWE